MLTDRQEEILTILRANPLVTQHDLADQLGVTRATVAGHIRQLTQLGFIRGRGYLFAEADYVCVVGGSNIDIEGRVPKPLRAGDSNPGTILRSPGGVGRNIAENLARLDVPTRLVTAFGRDHEGTWLHEQTAGAGVDLVDALISDSARTATYMSVLDSTGEMTIAVNDMAVTDALNPAALESRRNSIANAAVVVADCNLGTESLGYVSALAGRGPLFVDPVSVAKADRISAHLGSVHTLKPNRAEAAHLSGVEISGKRSLKSAAQSLLESGVNRVVISLGSEGVYYADSQASGTLVPNHQDVASVTGAGDALMAGLVHSHLADLPIDEAVRFGLAAAVLSASSQTPVASDFSANSVLNLIKKDTA